MKGHSSPFASYVTRMVVRRKGGDSSSPFWNCAHDAAVSRVTCKAAAYPFACTLFTAGGEGASPSTTMEAQRG